MNGEDTLSLGAQLTIGGFHLLTFIFSWKGFIKTSQPERELAAETT